MNRCFFIGILLLCACSTSKVDKVNMVVNGDENDAIMNAVFDFIHTENKLLKDDKTFLVYTENIEDKIGVSIMGDPNSILFIIEEDGSRSYRAFPTMLFEADEKLFFWYDETKSVTDAIINTLYKYNFVDTMIVNVYIPERTISEVKKGADYYFCRSDLSNYKKTAM
jgi:hypothetical protein